MEIRKILELLEAAPPQTGAVGSFGKNPNAPAASTAQPPTAGKPVVGTGLVAGSETQGGQVSYGAGASAQRSAAPKPAATTPPPNTNALGVAAQANVPGSPTAVNVPASKPAAASQAAAQPAAAPAKTYGGGYDPSKAQYAYSGGKPTAPQPTASATQSAALDTAKADAIGGSMQPAVAQPAAPAQTSDQIATAALNAPDQGTSGTSLGREAGFGQMAEENVEEDTDQSKDKLPTVRQAMQADKKEIEDQFSDPSKESPYNKDTRALDKGSKSVNTIADFEEDIDHALAEMMRLSGLPLKEKAPPGAKAERMVKHIKKGYAKDGELTDKEKSIAYATAWKAKKAGKLDECGDMDTHNMQKDRLNVSTNMSSDGTKDVTINAQGDQADALLQMLKMAGMHHHHKEPEIVMVSGDEEMMDEGVLGDKTFNRVMPVVKRIAGEVSDYDRDEFGEEMWSLLDQKYGPEFAQSVLQDDLDFYWNEYTELTGQELDEAKKTRVTKYSNTPDEEYETVHAITRQGNDLNREKRQYAGKPKSGDNPMAESLLDADLDAMLESILVREEDPKTENEVDEGWEDIKTGVSDFVGDMFNTEPSIRRRSQQFRDLETMQQKYKPGTPEYDQLEMRKNKQKERYYGDQGEVVDKTGEPIKVLPPEQWGKK